MEYYRRGEDVVRTSTTEDIAYLKDKLRKSDVDEVWASHHYTPEQALKISYDNSSLCITIALKGIPVIMFGISPATLTSDTAVIWLLGSDRIKEIAKPFAKRCRRFIHALLKNYRLLENYVDARNRLSIRWLKWCGAVIEDARPAGVDNLPFHHFYFRSTECQLK